MSLKFKKNIYLEKLDRLMGYDLSSNTPPIAYLNIDGVARAWIFISVLTTPYIVWLLFRLKKFGWFFSFFIFVVAPFLYNIFGISNVNASIFISLLATINWCVFLFLLKSSYQSWREPDFKNTPGSDFE